MLSSKGRVPSSLLLPLVAEAMTGPAGYAMSFNKHTEYHPCVGCCMCGATHTTLYKREGEMICKQCKQERGL